MIRLCFSCFIVNILKDFCVIAVLRQKNRLVYFNAITTGIPTPFPTLAMETPPVITVNVIRHVSIKPAIVLNQFIFLATFHKVQFHQANMLQFQLVFSNEKTVAVGIKYR